MFSVYKRDTGALQRIGRCPAEDITKQAQDGEVSLPFEEGVTNLSDSKYFQKDA